MAQKEGIFQNLNTAGATAGFMAAIIALMVGNQYENKRQKNKRSQIYQEAKELKSEYYKEMNRRKQERSTQPQNSYNSEDEDESNREGGTIFDGNNAVSSHAPN